MRKEILLISSLIIAVTLLVGCSLNKIEQNNQPQTTPEKNKTCDDTEKGIDYYVNGELTVCDFVTLEEPRGSPVGCALHNDLCGSEPNVLLEKYCDGDEFKFEKYICPNGCEEGACIR